MCVCVCVCVVKIKILFQTSFDVMPVERNTRNSNFTGVDSYLQ